MHHGVRCTPGRARARRNGEAELTHHRCTPPYRDGVRKKRRMPFQTWLIPRFAAHRPGAAMGTLPFFPVSAETREPRARWRQPPAQHTRRVRGWGAHTGGSALAHVWHLQCLQVTWNSPQLFSPHKVNMKKIVLHFMGTQWQSVLNLLKSPRLSESIPVCKICIQNTTFKQIIYTQGSCNNQAITLAIVFKITCCSVH